MSLSRRGFLGRLLVLPMAGAAVLQGDWTSLGTPTVPLTPALGLDAINAITVAQIVPGIQDDFFQRSPFLTYLRDREPHWQAGRAGTPMVGTYERVTRSKATT